MISKQLLQPILSWPKDGRIPLCVACDVGGSGTIVRLSSFFDENQYLDLPKLPTRSTKDFVGTLNKVSDTLKSLSGDIKCISSSLSFAGPITENTVVITNWPGRYVNRTLSLTELPDFLFPKEKTKFLNDTESTAYGIVALNRQGVLEKYIEKLFVESSPKGGPVSDRRTAVICPAVGLGCSLIVQTPLFHRKIVVPTELGHLELPIVGHKHVNHKLEKDLVKHISNQNYDGELAVEFEDVASGKGLCNIYQFLYHNTNGKLLDFSTLDGGKIAQMAKDKDPVAYKALTMYNQMVIRAAKSISTAMNCDSVILASDSQVFNNFIIKENYDTMKNEFYEFIRPNWLNTITVFTQKEKMNFNLCGTSHMAHTLAKK